MLTVVTVPHEYENCYKQTISYIFDKHSGKLYLKSQNLLFQSEVKGKELNAIKQVLVIHKTLEDGAKRFHLKLVFNSGKSIHLYSLKDEFDLEIQKTIENFLDINQE